MSKLTPDQRNSRLRLDWNIASRMNGPLAAIQAFRSMADLAGRKHPIQSPEDSHKAVAYLVEYHIRSLIGAAKFHDRFDISMDLMAGGNYPFSDPACFVVSRPIPWSPHFLTGNGSVCLGELWTAARGNITLGHLIIHVAKLLNFDEPDREPSYGGWNAKAMAYWRHVMKRQPVTNGLSYPVIPPEFTHGVTQTSTPLFRPAAVATPFAPARTLFRPVGG